jgi:hypothetical protein
MQAGMSRAARVSTGPSKMVDSSLVWIMSRQALGKSANSSISSDLGSRRGCALLLLLSVAASYVTVVGCSGLILTCRTAVLLRLLPLTGPLAAAAAAAAARGVVWLLAVAAERGVVGADATACASAAAAASVATDAAAGATVAASPSSPAGASAGTAALPLRFASRPPLLLLLPAWKPSKPSVC